MGGGGQTLYERVGGERGVARLVDEFYARVLADRELAAFFEHTSMERQRRMQTSFFYAALDGPAIYDGRSLAVAHHGRGIRPSHLARFIEHLLATLRSFALSEEDVLEVISRIDTYADEITGDTSVDA
jgi:hemoglobin